MTRQQAELEYRKLLTEWNKEKSEIMDRAKREGIWKPGLDSNGELFKDIADKYKRKLQELRDSIDE